MISQKISVAHFMAYFSIYYKDTKQLSADHKVPCFRRYCRHSRSCRHRSSLHRCNDRS